MLAVTEFVETLLSSETVSGWSGLVWLILPTLVEETETKAPRNLAQHPLHFQTSTQTTFSEFFPFTTQPVLNM